MILHRNEPLRFDELDSSLMGKVDGTSFTSDAGTLNLDALVKRHTQRVLEKTEGKIHGDGGAGELLVVGKSEYPTKQDEQNGHSFPKGKSCMIYESELVLMDLP